jgi:tRNA(adenine34) deaminase
MDIKFMQLAIEQAKKAQKKDEVPIGAVIVYNDKVIAKAHNLMEKKKSATAHAEILAIEKACKKVKGWRLLDCEMYVTVEPCAMCAGAIANARLKTVYFGAYEEKSGCAESKYPILKDNGLNHSVNFQGGIMREECSKILTEYFKNKRKKK